MKRILLASLMTVMLGCDNATSDTEDLSMEKKIIGEWNNISLRVGINSKNNTDSNEVFEVDRAQWEEKLKIKPIRTFFRSDSTWNSAHYNLGDTLIYDPSGKWWLDGDKLTMLQLVPSADTTIYTFKIVNDTATFEAMLDWDMDGKKDDGYFGKQIRVSSK